MKNLYHLAACCNKSIFIFFLVMSLTSKAQESMRANLYVVDANGTTLVDGNLTNYNNIYSNAVDINDAWKMSNPGINFGILRSDINLVVERRSIYSTSDTTFFRLWNLPAYHYRIKFMLKDLNHGGMIGFLKDSYLNTQTPIALNDTTYVDFNITANPASAAQMRFQLIYGPNIAGTGPVSVNITGIQAQRKGKDVLVEWKTADEIAIESYRVERSADGRNFNELSQVAATNTALAKTYSYIDPKAGEASSFYRIKALSRGGKIQYSNIAKINALTAAWELAVYPNPVANKTVQLQFNNQPAGCYNFTLLGLNGFQEQLSSIQVNELQVTKSLGLPKNLPAGVYQLEVMGPDHTRIVKSILVL